MHRHPNGARCRAISPRPAGRPAAGPGRVLVSTAVLLCVLVFGSCSDAPAGPVVGRFGSYSLEPDEVARLVASVESVPADVNAVAAIAVLWADFVALAELLADDPELEDTDFDAAVVPVMEQEMIDSLRSSLFPVDTAVGEDELLAAYEATDPPTRLRASHILLRYRSQGAAERNRVRAEADGLVARLRRGESFARLARDFSDDPGTAPSGGSLGEFSAGEMLPQIDSALADLDVGRIGGPLETDLGLHLVRLDERRVVGMADAAADLRASILVRRRLTADSALVALAEGDVAPLPTEGALDLVRQFASTPESELSSRALGRTVASHAEGELTLGEVGEALREQGPAFAEQVARGSDEAVGNYLIGLLRRELLVDLARQENLAPTQTRVEAMRDRARNELLGAGRDLGLHRLDPAPGEPLEQAIARRARLALERVLLGGTDGLVLGAMTEEVRRGRALVLDQGALGSAVLAIASARANRSASPLELGDTARLP